MKTGQNSLKRYKLEKETYFQKFSDNNNYKKLFSISVLRSRFLILAIKYAQKVDDQVGAAELKPKVIER